MTVTLPPEVAAKARAATPHAGEMHGFLKNREPLQMNSDRRVRSYSGPVAGPLEFDSEIRPGHDLDAPNKSMDNVCRQ